MMKTKSVSTWLRVLLVVMLLGSLAACFGTPLVLKKTEPLAPRIMKSNAVKDQKFTKLLFLSPDEARCPNQCSEVVRTKNSYSRFVNEVEKLLMEKGFDIISGAIVSRVETKLSDSQTREKWDRVEKALLLGKDTGADAIFEIKDLFVDEVVKTYLRRPGEKEYREVPKDFANQFAANEKAAIFKVNIWQATVELRMIDMSGRVIWSGTKTVALTDVLPSDWIATLKAKYPNVEVSKSNYDYQLYYFNRDLISATVQDIIKELVMEMPGMV